MEHTWIVFFHNNINGKTKYMIPADSWISSVSLLNHVRLLFVKRDIYYTILGIKTYM